MTGKRKLAVGIAALVMLAMVGVAGFFVRPVGYFNELTYVREYFHGVENHSLEVAGRRMHYEIEGPIAGAPVVLIHGLGGRAEDWASLAPYLAKAGFRVYMPDLVGYGRSERPEDFSYSVRDEAEQVVAFLNAVGLKQVDLGGWSMGGGIVQHVAFKHADRVRRLMLFDSIGVFEMPTWNVQLFTPRTADELSQLDVLLMPHPPVVPAFVARDIVRISDERAWIIHRAVDSMLTGQDATDTMLPKMQMPVLLVWGALDRITPVELGEKMYRLVPQSQLDVVDGCGHLAPGQCADRIGPRVVEFLKQ
jgi:pimeloyl-ACP methyl ester carboxylesterase